MLERNLEEMEINFHIDSQSAIKALGSHASRSKYVWEWNAEKGTEETWQKEG